VMPTMFIFLGLHCDICVKRKILVLTRLLLLVLDVHLSRRMKSRNHINLMHLLLLLVQHVWLLNGNWWE
jgi:hypothetical protein